MTMMRSLAMVAGVALLTAGCGDNDNGEGRSSGATPTPVATATPAVVTAQAVVANYAKVVGLGPAGALRVATVSDEQGGATFELRARTVVNAGGPWVDDIRRLDWKVFAKTDRLQIKQTHQETTLDLLVMVDSSGSMNYGSRTFEDASGEGKKTSLDGRTNWTKYDHATALAAALSYITLHQGDRAGLFVYADEIRAAVRRSSSQGTWRQIVGALSLLPLAPENRGRPTALSRAVDQAIASVTNRCLIALVSDFFCEPDELQDVVARLRHRRHDVIAFQVLDRAELEFDFLEPAPFEGLENEGRVRLDPRAIRESYLELIHAHIDKVEKVFRGAGYDYQRLSTHDWLGPPMAAFVARRNSILKRSKYA